MIHKYDLVCLSHLRWDFVFQRPQHLLSRCAKEQDRRVFFFEEPVYDVTIGNERYLELRKPNDALSLWVAVPHLPPGTPEAAVAGQDALLRDMLRDQDIERYVLWFYTPMALEFAKDLNPIASVYDAMDQLSAFRGAPPSLIENENRLFEQVDLVFTGGQSLYEAKRGRHQRVFPFPSSVDAAHFSQARSFRRSGAQEPEDQAAIGRPRVGFFGVIDERLDIDLLAQIAEMRPQIEFVMIGPVVKIDPNTLPNRVNIHYLGGKPYKELPSYLAGWDAAMMPFAINESTEFISPTKTPEYLAAGCPVVSTPIKDVVRPYESLKLVHIARTAEEFCQALDAALAENEVERMRRVDDFLSRTSWDKTWRRMSELIDIAIDVRAESANEQDLQQYRRIDSSPDARPAAREAAGIS